MAYTIRVDGSRVQEDGDLVFLSLLNDGVVVRGRIRVMVASEMTNAQARDHVLGIVGPMIAALERAPRFSVGQEITVP